MNPCTWNVGSRKPVPLPPVTVTPVSLIPTLTSDMMPGTLEVVACSRVMDVMPVISNGPVAMLVKPLY